MYEDTKFKNYFRHFVNRSKQFKKIVYWSQSRSKRGRLRNPGYSINVRPVCNENAVPKNIPNHRIKTKAIIVEAHYATML